MDVEVKGIKKGFLWFKTISFEVSYGDNPRYTDCYYTLGDLVSALMNMNMNKLDIWKIINQLEKNFYKIK